MLISISVTCLLLDRIFQMMSPCRYKKKRIKFIFFTLLLCICVAFMCIPSLAFNELPVNEHVCEFFEEKIWIKNKILTTTIFSVPIWQCFETKQRNVCNCSTIYNGLLQLYVLHVVPVHFLPTLNKQHTGKPSVQKS